MRYRLPGPDLICGTKWGNFPVPVPIDKTWSHRAVAYCFCKTEIMAPFRHLLSQTTPLEWTDDLETAFSASNETIMEMIRKGVHTFDPELETCLSTDYSKEGMGWILQ